MPTQPSQKEIAKILEEARNLFGIEIEVPAETTGDLAREAQSVLTYFSTKGHGFREKKCKKCGGIFAYSWDVDSISFCSIVCAKQSLQDVGLDWNPDKPPSERWGRYVPAVVPPQALDLLKDHPSSPGDPA